MSILKNIFAESKWHSQPGSSSSMHQPKGSVVARSSGYKFAALNLATLMVYASPAMVAAAENRVEGLVGADGLRGSIDVKGVVQSEFEIAKLHGLKEAWSCPDGSETHVPFVMTNEIGLHDSATNHMVWGSSSDSSGDKDERFYYIKDATHCTGRDGIIGTEVSADEFKDHIKTYLEENDLDAVMYNMHGWSVEPEFGFGLGHRWQTYYQEASRWLFIPLMWRTHWGDLAAYDWDRNTSAIRAGKQLVAAAQAGVFKADYTTHMMTHSMGAWALRVFAQTLNNPEVFFDKVFMVAADARSDLFADDYNPAAPRTDEERLQEEQQSLIQEEDDFDSSGSQAMSTCNYNVARHSQELKLGNNEDLGIPVEECQLNGGYDISKLSNEIHVLWNRKDRALLVREAFQAGSGNEKMRQALGKHGDWAESYMNLQYFKDKVTFHNLTDATAVTYSPEDGVKFVDIGGVGHNYQLGLPAVAIYLNSQQLQFISRVSCRNLPCDSQVCPANQQEVAKTFCHFQFRFSETCCTLAPQDETNQVLSLT